jgi:hypothetical protein
LSPELVFFGQSDSFEVAAVFGKIKSKKFRGRMIGLGVYSPRKEFVHVFFGGDQQGRGEVGNVVLSSSFSCLMKSHRIARIASVGSFFHLTS